jgi:glycosyltransferase involved in cell wall biosynthesis
MRRDFFFSIVIPSYNRAHTICRTLESILKQSFKDFEVIIVDDGSTDNTKERLKPLLSLSNVLYYFYEINCGANYAKNLGAKYAKGKYLVFLDSDDLFVSENSLQIIYKIIIDEGYPSLAMFSCISLSNGERLAKKPNYNGFVSFLEYFRGKYLGEYLPIVEKSSFMKVQFSEKINGGEGITWNLIAKEAGELFMSSAVVRLYDDMGDDRLSIPSKKNLRRIRNVFLYDMQVNFVNYLLYYRIGMLKSVTKVLYYQFKSSIVK